MATVRRLRFGIVLYSPLAEGEGRHWALGIGRNGDPSIEGAISIYQIVYKGNNEPGFKTLNKQANPTRTNRYYGIVDLGTWENVNADHIHQLLGEQLAEQGDFVLPAGKNWSCAWFVIRALRRLIAAGYAIPGLPADNLALYNRVLAAAERIPQARNRIVPLN